MKYSILSLVILGNLGYAHANEEKVCNDLLTQAREACAELICEQVTPNDKTCVKDGEFKVLANECAHDILPEAIKDYNATNNTNYSCDNY